MENNNVINSNLRQFQVLYKLKARKVRERHLNKEEFKELVGTKQNSSFIDNAL